MRLRLVCILIGLALILIVLDRAHANDTCPLGSRNLECPPIGWPTDPLTDIPTGEESKEKSGEQLIHEAVEGGLINDQTALLYRVYLAFRDERLPQEYRRLLPRLAPSEMSILREVHTQWTQLSEETQQALTPFLIPPYYQGSWYERRQQRALSPQIGLATPVSHGGLHYVCSTGPPVAPFSTGWHCVDGTVAKVRVWWWRHLDEADPDADGTKAQEIRDELDNVIWPKLTSLMARTPISDEDLQYSGGNGSLDIVVMDFCNPLFIKECKEKPCNITKLCVDQPSQIGWYALDPKKCPTAGYIILDRRLSGDELRGALTHEFMHAITSAYTIKDCNLNDYYWLREATATWAEHYVFPDVDSERPFVPIFMGTPEQPLESLTPSDHEYSAYLFLFYLYHNYTPQYVPAIWQQGEQISGSLAAINSALKSQSGGQGFTHFWPEFVRRNWNQPPFNQYERWDPGRSPLTDGAVTYGTLTNINGHPIDQNHIESVKLDGGGDFEYELRAQVSHLAAHYFHFEFPAFDDQSDKNVRSVGFTDFGLVKDNPQAHIQALIKYEGKDWEVEDWSKKSTEYGMLIGLCRDTKKERVEELVIIISNTDWEKKEQLKLTSGRLPRLIANNIGCSKWGGEILNIVRSPYPGPGLVTNVVRTEITVTASERQPPFYLPGRLEGKGEGRWSSWMDGCEGLGDGLHHSASNLLLNSLNAAADAMERRFYTWNLADYPPIPGPTNTLIFTCPGDPPKKAYTQPVWMHSPLGAPTHGTGFVKSDGTIGDKSSDQLPADIETRWVFSPLPE